MKILVAIANYGQKNLRFAQRLIDTYRGFSDEVDVVVLSNIEKDFGPDVEVRVGLPTSDGWSLPFAHKQLFFERRDQYDLFIYSEDDTEVTQVHVDAFMAATEILPKDHIAGFIRYEDSPNGTRFYSTCHGNYYWDPNSVLRISDRVFARYTNDHAACYLLTRRQLAHCIDSGGFMVGPYKGRYDMLCSAATDPYTRCELTKVICISHIEEFLLHHLPDLYLGRIGVEKQEIDAQIVRLLQLEGSNEPRGPLVEPTARLELADFDKCYSEPVRPDVIELIPVPPARILSVGCTRGLTEAALIARGHRVTAIPLDCVIAEAARMRGIETTTPDVGRALEELGDARFDVLLFNDLLDHIEEPPSLVRSLARVLAPGGCAIASFRNWRHPSVLQRRLSDRRFAAVFEQAGDFARSGVHRADAGEIRGWLAQAGFRVERSVYDVQGRYRRYAGLLLGLANRWLGQVGAMRAVRAIG